MRGFFLGLAAAALLALPFGLGAAPARAQIIGGVIDQAGAVAASGCVVGPTVCLTYRGHGQDATDRSSGNYSFLSSALGTASADRIVVVALQSGSASAASAGTPTICGNAMTQATQSLTTSTFLEFWYAAVPTGTACDILVPVGSGTLQRMAIDWWTITSTTQTAYAARSGATPNNSTSTSQATAGFNIPSGGVGLTAVRIASGSPSSPTLTASGGSVNTRNNASVASESQWDVVGDTGVSGASSTFTISVGASAALQIVGISWGP